MTDWSPLVYMLIGALGSLVMWLVLGPVMTGLGVKRLARRAAAGDPKSMEFFYDLGDVLIKWAAEREIPTGRKIKVSTDETDENKQPVYKEVPEVLTPIQLVARSVGQYTIQLVKGQAGGVRTQLGRIIQDEAGQSGGLSTGAISALSRGKVLPALTELLAPSIIAKFKGGKDAALTQESTGSNVLR